MSDTKRKAMVARDLLENGSFREIADEIRAEAGAVFFNPASSPDQLAAAHARIRSIETFTAAIQARLDADTVEEKKAQHRGKHD
jgi:hypothetical protein